MKRKGQASLDFLSTYGWALMILAIAIGALYTFLDFNPETFVPSTCSIGDTFNCPDFLINESSKTVTLSLTNEAGVPINLSGMSCEYVGVSVLDRSAQETIIQPGEKFHISCNMSSKNVVFKKKAKIDVAIIYFKTGNMYPSTSEGFVTGNIMK